MENEATLQILFVEDDPAHAEIALRNIANCQAPHRIVHVTDGQAALDYLYRQGEYGDPAAPQRPDLILLDLRLPKVDGLEVLRTIKKDDTLSQIPVVILTTSAAERDMAMAYDNHASSYLVKPLDFDTFKDLLATFCKYWLTMNHFSL